MKPNEQDEEIISSLITGDDMTAYSISKDIGIGVPQVQYRLDKLAKCGIIKSKKSNSKMIYYIHPALKSQEVMEEVASYIKAMVDTIYEVERLSPDGMKVLVSFIVNKIEVTEEELEVEEDTLLVKDESELSGEIKTVEQEAIDKFREYIGAYAKEKGLKILNVKGWTNGKIEWMALNGKKCACKPDERVCPCPEGLVEVEKKGKCLCTVFGA